MDERAMRLFTVTLTTQQMYLACWDKHYRRQCGCDEADVQAMTQSWSQRIADPDDVHLSLAEQQQQH